jgi:hypothetical protein
MPLAILKISTCVSKEQILAVKKRMVEEP